MTMPLVLLALVMAVFGVLCFQRGTRAGLLIAGLTLVGLMLVGRLGDRLVDLINGLGRGAAFVAAGGLAALGSGGNLDQAMQSMRSAPALVTSADSGGILSLAFAVVVTLGFLVARIRYFQGRSSFVGLLAGLVTGYFIGAIGLRALMPESSGFLPLPFGLGGPVVQAVSTGGMTAGDTLERGLNWLTSAVRPQTLAIILAVLIAAFVFLVTRGGSSGKKG